MVVVAESRLPFNTLSQEEKTHTQFSISLSQHIYKQLSQGLSAIQTNLLLCIFPLSPFLY